MIPVAAIERIEILKDGGSAIYGADAVAGVINIITKSDYQGIEGTAGYGQSSRNDAQEKHVGLTAGFGDLTKDRFNVLLGVDYFKRDPILRKDRDLTSSINFTRFGGSDGRSGFAPTGNVVDPASGAYTGIQYRPCPADSVGANNVCRFDFNKSILTSYNGADRLSGLGLASFQLTPDIKLFAEVTYARTKDLFQAQPVPDYFLVPISDPSQAPYDATDTLDGAGTPIGSVYIAGRFMQGGPRMTERTATLLNTVVGAEGTNFGLDWKVSAGHGESKVTNQDSNYFDYNLWSAATNSGAIDPTVTTNDPTLVAGLKLTPLRVGKSSVDFLNLQVGGDLYKLPAGTLRYAVGAQYWKEKLSDQPDQNLQTDNVVGGIQQSAVDASREIKAVYGELAIPILSNVEGQLAARYDKYPDYSQTSPKVALKYTPIPELAFRGSYTQSFRAPVLKQLYGATEQGATDITDPASCVKLGIALDPMGQCQVSAFQVNGSNPNLKPEKGTTYNLGAVFEVARNFSGSVDFWRINKKDSIASPSLTSAIDQGLFARQGPQILIFTNLQNIAELQTSGVDVDARLRFPGTAIGNVTLRNSTTYYMSVKNRLSGGDAWDNYNGTYVYPRYRNVFSATTEYGPWTLNAALRSVGGFWDTDQPYPIPAGTRKVASDHEVDAQASYAGFKGWTLTGGIKNLFDRMPPFSNQNASSNSYSQLGFAELYTARGRFFYMSANYKFR
jgi:iron complex outermembrane receptor protein